MRRLRPLAIVSTMAACALLSGGCGSSHGTRGEPQRSTPPADHAATSPIPAARRDGTCRGVLNTAMSSAPPPPVSSAQRRALDAAALRLTRAGSRFRTDLSIAVAGRPTARATLLGRRTPDGASAAALTWHGAASVLLPDARLRIVDDHIYAQQDPAPGWQRLGSASGVALDVGRELLEHPFLLDPVDAVPFGHGDVAVQLRADGPALRAYAGTERHGLATDALVRAERLTITSFLRGGRLTSDHFELVTRLPASFGRAVGGRRATVVGSTVYCPLRPADRRAISAPPTAT